MSATITRDPKVWIGCIAAYNDGILHGEWVEIAEDVDEMWDAIKAVLASSPVPGAEEWRVHDYEDLHPWNPGEYPSIEKLVMAAQLIREHGGAAAGWLSNDDSCLQGIDDYDDLDERFHECYRGTWESDEDYAREYVGDCGLPGVGFLHIEGRDDYLSLGVKRKPWSETLDELDSNGLLDWETIARQVTEDVTVVEADGDRHYFRSE